VQIARDHWFYDSNGPKRCWIRIHKTRLSLIWMKVGWGCLTFDGENGSHQTLRIQLQPFKWLRVSRCWLLLTQKEMFILLLHSRTQINSWCRYSGRVFVWNLIKKGQDGEQIPYGPLMEPPIMQVKHHWNYWNSFGYQWWCKDHIHMMLHLVSCTFPGSNQQILILVMSQLANHNLMLLWDWSLTDANLSQSIHAFYFGITAFKTFFDIWSLNHYE